MKKIIFTILITSIICITNVMSVEMNCSQFQKISAKYLECKAINLKNKSAEIKLRVADEADELKQKITTDAKDNKKKFDKSTFKKKLIKFKNSKTLTEFMEK